MEISFVPFTKEHLPKYYEWAERPQVKDTWFIEGYEPVSAIEDKIGSESDSVPFVICLDGREIGFIQYWHWQQSDSDCIFARFGEGTVGIDLFIAESDCLDRGVGTEVVSLFVQKIISELNPKHLVIDPFTWNKRAIRCFEKAGFVFSHEANDGISDCYVMKYIK